MLPEAKSSFRTLDTLAMQTDPTRLHDESDDEEERKGEERKMKLALTSFGDTRERGRTLIVDVFVNHVVGDSVVGEKIGRQ